MERGQLLLTIAVANVLCKGGQNVFFFLLAEGQSVQCSVKRYSGRGKERVKDGGGVRPQGLTETL